MVPNLIDYDDQRATHYGTYIGELNNSQLSEVTQAVMGSVLIHDEGDVLHRFRTEPLRHLACSFSLNHKNKKGGVM